MARHNELGTEAELAAVGFLKNKGLLILQTNYRYDRAEVDIIARNSKFIICVEVKARSTLDFGLPHEAVTGRKIRQLVKVMNHYVEKAECDMEVRFDIVSVLKKGKEFHIEHFEDAFYHF